MKKIISMFGIFSIALGMVAPAFADNLYAVYGKKTLVKVFVHEPVDKTSKKSVKTLLLKSALEKALKDRKSVKFEIVPSADKADLSIAANVTDIYWTDHDPLDMIMGVGGAAMDAATVEDYIRMTADFTITDSSKHSVWHDQLISTLTKKDMPEPVALDLIGDNMAKLFITKAFGKKQASRR